MNSQRFTPEFKEETVRQVAEQGHGAPDVAARFGVSPHNLYTWVKAISPDQSEQQSKEISEARSELLRHHSRLRRSATRNVGLTECYEGILPVRHVISR